MFDVVDLCSGAAGGWSLGLHRAGFRTIAACEAVAWRRDLYAVNNPGVKLYDDLRTITGAAVRRDTGCRPGLVAGSPPCKEYSSANQGAGGLDADDLYLHAVRFVGEIRPRWCAFENSAFVKTRGYDRIAPALEALGYACWPLVVGVGNAGGSHQRKRSVVIGLDTDAPRPQRRPAGQSRVGADAGGADGPLSGPDRRGRGSLAGVGEQDRADLDEGRIWDERAAGIAGVFRGPVGASDLSGHLRAYDGVSAGLAEQCREAYGDAVCPQVAEAVGRAIIAVELSGAI